MCFPKHCSYSCLAMLDPDWHLHKRSSVPTWFDSHTEQVRFKNPVAAFNLAHNYSVFSETWVDSASDKRCLANIVALSLGLSDEDKWVNSKSN